MSNNIKHIKYIMKYLPQIVFFDHVARFMMSLKYLVDLHFREHADVAAMNVYTKQSSTNNQISLKGFL